MNSERNPTTRQIKKPKLTGRGLGRLLLLTLVADKLEKPTMTQEEVEELFSELEGEESDEFLEYAIPFGRIKLLLTEYKNNIEREKEFYENLADEINATLKAEDYYTLMSVQPRILTKSDYEQALAEAREELQSSSYSFFELAVSIVRKEIKQLEEKKETIFKDALAKTMQEAASQEVIEQCKKLRKQTKDSQEEKIISNLSKFEILASYLMEYGNRHSSIHEAGLDFKRDYPELTNLIQQTYSKLEGLEHLVSLTDHDFVKADLIDFQTAYKLNLCNARSTYEEPTLTYKGHKLNYGAAVITNCANSFIIDSSYYYYIGEGVRRHLPEDVLKHEKYKIYIHSIKKAYRISIALSYAYNFIIEQIAKLTGVNELKLLIDDRVKKETIAKNIEELKIEIEKFSDIKRLGLLKDEGDPEQIAEQIMSLYSLDFSQKDTQLKPKEKKQIMAEVATGKTLGLDRCLKLLILLAKAAAYEK